MDEKMGIVKRTPFSALKKLCEEYSLSRNIGGLLRKYEGLINIAIDKIKNKISIFTKSTQNEVLRETQNNKNENLGEEMLKNLMNENENKDKDNYSIEFVM